MIGGLAARCGFIAVMVFVCCLGHAASEKEAKEKPLFREFMGLNVHTVLFQAKEYLPTTRLVRDYHGFGWDVGEESDYPPQFPFARNRVDWGELYGSWKALGYGVHVSVMFDEIAPDRWANFPEDARGYGTAFARFFGPSGEHGLVGSVEIGNEPTHYSDEEYRQLLIAASEGIRKGDPRMKIATCSVQAGPSDDYHKTLSLLEGLNASYDILNVHAYAEVEGYPTWKRSYPEDPKIDYLTRIQKVMDWRDQNAPEKAVWVTEFGWDSTTQPQATEGTFKDWVGVTDTQQAQYLVRSYLVFSAMEMERSYLFWFDDQDQASVHGSSGLTRKGTPKPSFHAVAHLLKSLGEYRFVKKVEEKRGDLYLYEYRHGSDPKRVVWAVWSPTGGGRSVRQTLRNLPGKLERIERMPLDGQGGVTVDVKPDGDGLEIEVGESPMYLWFS